MGLILRFCVSPHPPGFLDVSHNGLAALMDMYVLNGDFLLTFTAVTI
jgi:hypothetical protein